jgi:hypothetical protein
MERRWADENTKKVAFSKNTLFSKELPKSSCAKNIISAKV